LLEFADAVVVRRQRDHTQSFADRWQNFVTIMLRRKSIALTRGALFVHEKEGGGKFMNNIRASALVSLVLSALLVAQANAAGEWEIVPSPNIGTQANTLFSVATATDNDVWAVGAAYDEQLTAYRTVIEHWNGASWSVVPSPNASNGYNLLNGVAVVAANDVWAVGQAADGNTYSTMIEHMGGGKGGGRGPTWSIVPSPNVAGSSSVLTAITVVSASDLWAVGYSTDGNFQSQPLTLHWNGSAWSIVPSATSGNDMLFAVDAVASNDVWAIGQTRIGYSSNRTLTMHWNGSAWSVVPSPNDSTTHNDLYGVAAVAANDVWAVGQAGSLKTLAIHWNGAGWSLVPTPAFDNSISNEVLVGIVALSSGDIASVGQFMQSSVQHTLTEHWNGSSWTLVPSPNAESSSNRLSGITATPTGTLWAVGTTGVFGQPERTLILRKSPEKSRD
jgi:hypothetical protein